MLELPTRFHTQTECGQRGCITFKVRLGHFGHPQLLERMSVLSFSQALRTICIYFVSWNSSTPKWET